MPLRDRLDDSVAATVFDYLARTTGSRLFVSEPDEVRANFERLTE